MSGPRQMAGKRRDQKAFPKKINEGRRPLLFHSRLHFSLGDIYKYISCVSMETTPFCHSQVGAAVHFPVDSHTLSACVFSSFHSSS